MLFLAQAFYNTKIIEVLNKLIGGVAADRSASTGNGGGTMMGSALYQISLPDGLESRTYGSLYKLLSRRGQIPLGILRGVFANTKTGPKANKLPYVYTNPSKDTELFTCDKIFMLSPTPIKLGRGRGNVSAIKYSFLLSEFIVLVGFCPICIYLIIYSNFNVIMHEHFYDVLKSTIGRAKGATNV